MSLIELLINLLLNILFMLRNINIIVPAVIVEQHGHSIESTVRHGKSEFRRSRSFGVGKQMSCLKARTAEGQKNCIYLRRQKNNSSRWLGTKVQSLFLSDGDNHPADQSK